MADVLAKTKVNTLAKKKKEGNTWEHTLRSKGKALVDMMANTLAAQWTQTTGDTPLEVEAKEVVLTLGGSLEEAEAGTRRQTERSRGKALFDALAAKQAAEKAETLAVTLCHTLWTRRKCPHAALHLISGKS